MGDMGLEAFARLYMCVLTFYDQYRILKAPIKYWLSYIRCNVFTEARVWLNPCHRDLEQSSLRGKSVVQFRVRHVERTRETVPPGYGEDRSIGHANSS